MRTAATLGVLSMTVLFTAFDAAIVAIALPTIQRDLHLTGTALQWVVSGSALGLGGFLLLGGRVADLTGPRRSLLWSVAAYATASVAAGIAGAGWALVSARVLAGVSLAFVVPAGLSIVTATYSEGAGRERALSVYSAVGAGGWMSGLLLGGLLTAVSWRLVFLIQAPLALAVLIATRWLVPRDAPDAPSDHLSALGAVSGTAALLALVYTLTLGPSRPLWSGQRLTGLAVAGVAAAVFGWAERRATEPLVPREVRRSPQLMYVNLTALAYAGSYAGFLFIGTLYMQRVLGWSALSTALAFLPAALTATALSRSTGSMIERWGVRRVLVGGMATVTVAYVLLLRMDVHSTFPGVVLPTVVLVGIGAAVTFPSITIAGLAGVDRSRQGVVGGLLNSSEQIGAGVVVAAASATAAAWVGAGSTRSELLDGYRASLLVVGGVAALGLLTTIVIMLSGTGRAAR
jgi:MFS family permease